MQQQFFKSAPSEPAGESSCMRHSAPVSQPSTRQRTATGCLRPTPCACDRLNKARQSRNCGPSGYTAGTQSTHSPRANKHAAPGTSASLLTHCAVLRRAHISQPTTPAGLSSAHSYCARRGGCRPPPSRTLTLPQGVCGCVCAASAYKRPLDSHSLGGLRHAVWDVANTSAPSDTLQC